MSAVVETPRLRLRPWRDDDLDTLVRWHEDRELTRYLGPGPFTREALEAMLARHVRHWDEHGFGLWLAEDRETGEPVGRVGLSYHRMWPQDPEVGWLIDRPWQGRGLATEAGAAAMRYGFDELGFSRLVSICLEQNMASRRVMEKLGLRLFREVHDPQLDLRLWIHAIDR